MQFQFTQELGYMTCSRKYEPSTVYKQALAWDQGDGKITPENVEKLVPNSRFIGVHRTRSLSVNLEPIQSIHVIVERVA